MLTLFLFTTLLWAKDLPSNESPSLSQFSVTDIDGKKYDFRQTRGKVVLIVNTASDCGYTSQFKGLQTLQENYGKRGFLVLGFPSNDFRQEKAEAKETKKVACDQHGVKFPLMMTSKVSGPDKNPVFKYLVQGSETSATEVAWNFEKFLVDRSGKVRARYLSQMTPEDPLLKLEIEKLLGTKK